MKQNKFADVVYYSDNIYTVSDGMVSGGVAVTDGIITCVGGRQEISAFVGNETEVADYNDKLLMPGFIDGHTHMMPFVKKADFSKGKSVDDCCEIARQFYKENAEVSVVMGEKWYAANWGGTLPTRYDIDKVISDVPFLAIDLDIHLLWCNTKLLEKEGFILPNGEASCIDEVTSGRSVMVDTDESLIPTGILKDEICMEIFLKYQPEANRNTVKAMFDVWTQYGVTTVNDMDFYEADNVIYKLTGELLKDGELNVRTFASLDAALATDESIKEAKSYMNSDMFRLNSLKAFMDGTGAGHTAYMKRPYVGTTEYGNVYLSNETLLGYVKKASEHGLAMHTHCCGDRAVSEALSVYEKAVLDGVELDERFSIEHCDTTDIEDVARPAKLGISLNLTPDFLAPTYRWQDNPYIKVYDDETKEELWKIKSFIDTGVNVSFGTDYMASSMNPFDQLYRAIARKADDGYPLDGYKMEEAVDISQAIYCYTMGSAKSVGMEAMLGSIEAGKYADMIVVDTNLLVASADDIKKTKVLVTIVNGRMVFDRDSQ